MNSFQKINVILINFNQNGVNEFINEFLVFIEI